MSYCSKCGNQISESTKFCGKCGSAVTAAFANQSPQLQPQPKRMYESFSPPFMLGLGKSAVFTDSSLIFGNTEYPYAQLSPINLVTTPTQLTNGVAQVTVGGRILTLAYGVKDKERFAAALNYANEQIDLAHGNISFRLYFFK